MEKKICGRCKEEKSIDEFGKNKQKKDGRNNYCKLCANEVGREVRMAKRYSVLTHYSIGEKPQCGCCGEERMEFLSIDHINGNGKMHIESNDVRYNLAAWLIRNDFPEGYRVLCHNCNFAIGHYGYCPHQRHSTLTQDAEERWKTLKRGTVGDKHGLAKINSEIARTIKERLNKGERRSEIARDVGLTWESVNAIYQGRTWKKV